MAPLGLSRQAGNNKAAAQAENVIRDEHRRLREAQCYIPQMD